MPWTTSGARAQPSAAIYEPHDLSDDFMFGFDVRDDEDRKYLTEVVMHRIGREDDIRGFVRLSLLQGMEEWEQAICCASAMRDRASLRNSLDGQDILTFLSKIYGVDESGGAAAATTALPPPQGPSHPYIKRTSGKAGVTLVAETPVEIPNKKRKLARRDKNSPYWAETSAPVRREAGRTSNWPESKVTAKKIPKSREGSLEGTWLPASTVTIEQSRDYAVTSIPPASQHDYLKNATSTNTRKLLGQSGGNDTRDSSGDTGLALPGRKIPTLQDLNAPELNIASAVPNNGPDVTRAQQAATDENNPPASPKTTPKRKAKSPYFVTTKAAPSPPNSSSKRRPPRGTVSSIPFPRLGEPRFGLIQEELADDPFRLLVAVTFLIRTTGRAAIPVFRALMGKYPTPRDIAAAHVADITAMIQHLGLGVVRAATIQRYARIWLDDPPRNGIRYAVRNYHCAATAAADDASGIGGADEEGILYGDSGTATMTTTSSSAWEIGHMTQGPYALDSWRIFCRDVLRGVAADWKGGGREGEFQPEWMRVLPRDKELRACLRWMWMREGWLWDPVTGDKAVLPEDLRSAVQDGRVGYDDMGNLRILDESDAATS
ncbi:DNA glycosylase [Nemania serpens]|nr:DNA glycosylase [Nemania serpens]